MANRFVMYVGQWIDRTRAAGWLVKAGRYGGALAHKGIVFHFPSTGRCLHRPVEGIGLVKIKSNEDFWLLFHIGQVTKDLNKLNGVGYEYQALTDYEKYLGRLFIIPDGIKRVQIHNLRI